MPEFVKSVLIHAPIERVFALHERPDALELLSPSFPPMRVIRKTGGIETGSEVELKIGPVHWLARHTAYRKNQFFVDEQTSGPFAQWIHRHQFEPEGNATRLTDRIEYTLRGGAAVNALFGWTVQLGLFRMFRYRHRVTKRLSEANTRQIE